MVNNDDIIQYFNTLERSFYMDGHKEMAEMDRAAPIGHGQTISQPSLVLKMTLSLDVKDDSKVLEIGTGSGFQTDLLASFAQEVYTVERIYELHIRAQEKLGEKGFDNIHFKHADGSEGWKEHGPYDRIMVTAAAGRVPDEYIEQLADNGKMIIPIGDGTAQELTLVEKDSEGRIHSSFIEHVMFVRLQGRYD